MNPIFTNLTTERLFLRDLQPDDAEEIYRLRKDEKVNELIGRQSAVTIDDAREFIGKILLLAENYEVVMWAITLIGSNKLAGTILYWHIERLKDKAEVGYELLPEYQGKGIMTEALEKVIEFGFKELRFKTITANPNGKNLKSIQVLERHGFVKTSEDADGYWMYELKEPGNKNQEPGP
ncbi:MAG: GNAT family N-acetyltransferase [Bacteroidetes bacterium]|nr:GNAT family N-acetyltransferase [Bacteroidota bacterium]